MIMYYETLYTVFVRIFLTDGRGRHVSRSTNTLMTLPLTWHCADSVPLGNAPAYKEKILLKHSNIGRLDRDLQYPYIAKVHMFHRTYRTSMYKAQLARKRSIAVARHYVCGKVTPSLTELAIACDW